MIFPRVGQVRGDPLQFLDAAAGEPEPGHHLVEDEERPVGRAGRPQVLQEARLRAG